MKLNIFVSSTCYDLSQVRSDLKDFIAEIGHVPMLSEDYSFPIDTNKTTVENCIEAVRNHADLFILIMGNRYGYQINGDKSITNSEFLSAIEKKIPIYTFTLKQIVDILPVWKKNSNGDFSSIVDSTKIFEFVDSVRNEHNIWNFEFEKANDIKEVMKSQLSILFKNSLKDTIKLKDIDVFFIQNLSAKALRIMIEKATLYEINFFLQTFKDEISKYVILKNDYVYSLKFASENCIFDFKTFLEWSQMKYGIMHNYITSLNSLISNAFKHYFGEPGIPSDLKGLYYVSHKIGIIYRDILNWAIEANSLIVDDELIELKNIYSLLPEKIIQELEEYPNREQKRLDEVNERIKQGEKDLKITATLKLEISPDFINKYDLIINKLKKKKGLS